MAAIDEQCERWALSKKDRYSGGACPYHWRLWDWAANYAQALWLEKWRLKNLNEMLAKMFSPEEKALSLFAE